MGGLMPKNRSNYQQKPQFMGWYHKNKQYFNLSSEMFSKLKLETVVFHCLCRILLIKFEFL